MISRTESVGRVRRSGRKIGVAGLAVAAAVSMNAAPATAQDGDALPLGSLGETGSDTDPRRARRARSAT